MSFDPLEFYNSYPSKIILRPGYPARAQYRSTLMWDLYGKKVISLLGEIRTYADIGGCFGFGANAMAFHIRNKQGVYPQTKVFELSSEFIYIGKKLFPYIEFVQGNILEYEKSRETFDLASLIEVIEHIPEPKSFLSSLSCFTKYALIMTPMETGGDLFGAKQPIQRGSEHPDGHINFFSPENYISLLDKSGWEIIGGKYVSSLENLSNKRVLTPEQPLLKVHSWKNILQKGVYYCRHSGLIPHYLVRIMLGGGHHLCLARSRKFSLFH